MKFETLDRIYIDNFYIRYKKMVVSGYGFIDYITDMDDGSYSMNVNYINPSGEDIVFNVKSDDDRFHKIKTPLEYRMMKVNKIKERIQNEV